MTKVMLYLALVAAIFGAGYYVAHLVGERDLAAATSAWDKTRADLADKRANAEEAQRRAEQGQAEAILKAAENYEKGKADAKQDADNTVAAMRAGNIRLRDQWATCQVTTAAAVSASAGGQRADGEDRLRADGVGRILRAVGQCQAQRDALQEALIGERAALGQ
ncbi:endopeptidase [Luteibacter sp. NPDC031894]|uniref:endopeptidase n=1 Tax=Luteibacter sp. NPDC031894 TaxID=3390572 RepID=UPI003CFE69A3